MCHSGEWKMASIIGLEDESVEKICESVEDGFVVPANYNCPRSSCYFRRKKCSRFGYGKSKRSWCKEGYGAKN